jgi:hypothetical protein
MNIGREPSDKQEHVEVSDQGTVAQEVDYTAERLNKIDRITNIIWLIVGVIEIIIGARVLLRLLAANPDNPFASFAYRLARVFIWPFFGLIAEPAANGSVLELSSLIGMLFYLVIGWIIIKTITVIMVPGDVRHTRTLSRR